MKQIKVGYSEKSIDEAIKQLRKYQKKIENFIPDFLEACANKVIELANQNIEKYEFDSEIISGIQSGWTKKKGENTLLLENTNNKAVYIEFGVGQVGAQSSHDDAEKAGYRYDINNHGSEGWGFYLNEGEAVDILGGLYQAEIVGGNRLHIYTKGSPATMFAFNALMDFKDNEMYVDIAKQLLKGL